MVEVFVMTLLPYPPGIKLSSPVFRRSEALSLSDTSFLILPTDIHFSQKNTQSSSKNLVPKNVVCAKCVAIIERGVASIYYCGSLF